MLPKGKTQEKCCKRTVKDMENSRDTGALTVSRAEAGQKLLNFLQRRISAPTADFHRWIRTGQVRVNGSRARAFDRLAEGDAVRVPPFAQRLPAGRDTPRDMAEQMRSRLDIVFEDDDILVLAKPAGLPVQGGTGHRDSIASRLAEERAYAAFVPAPVHRLDKDTSGLLVAGKTYAAVRLLTDAMAGRGEARPVKEYLAWVEGSWPFDDTRELHDRLTKDEKAQRMVVLPAGAKPGEGQDARCMVTPLRRKRMQGRERTLLLVRLLTGRTHQIRVQLASRGHPVSGDPWYGEKTREGLKLHAFRLTIPVPGGKSRSLELPPPWQGAWSLAPDEKETLPL